MKTPTPEYVERVLRQLNEIDAEQHGEYVEALCIDAQYVIRALQDEIKAASDHAHRMSRQ